MASDDAPQPPADLPADPREFWRAGPGIEALDGEADPAPGGEVESALQKLGAAPFPKGKFPFLGFLATVYDHVATHARNRDRHGEPDPRDAHP
jgi:hypothetical protein